MDYFGARYYSNTQGRFTSADEPLVGQDSKDPQTWNLYVYTSNNPLSRIDPDGQRWAMQVRDGKTYYQFFDTTVQDENGKTEYDRMTGEGGGWSPVNFDESKVFEYNSTIGPYLLFPDGTHRARYDNGVVNYGADDGKILGAALAKNAIVRFFNWLLSATESQQPVHNPPGAPSSPAANSTSGSASENLPNLNGMTRTEARETLENAGFENKGTTPGGYEKWYHPDGSRIQIRPNGGVIRTGPKTTPSGGGNTFRPRIGPDGKPTSSHNTGETVSGN